MQYIINVCTYEVATLRYLVSALCTCRHFPAEYLVFEVSVKSGIGAALYKLARPPSPPPPPIIMNAAAVCCLLLLCWGMVHDPKTGGTLVKDLKALLLKLKFMCIRSFTLPIT